MFYFVLIICMVVATVFHEAAHYHAADERGLEPISISIGVGPVILRWGKLRVRLIPISGLVMVKRLPDEDKAYVAGVGPVANFALACFCLVFVRTNEGLPAVWNLISTGEATIAGVLYLLAGVNLFAFFFNMLPIRIGRLESDGFRVIEGWYAERRCRQASQNYSERSDY